MLLVVPVVVVPVVLVLLLIGIKPPRNEEDETEVPGAMDALRRGAPPMVGRMAGGSMRGLREGVVPVGCVWVVLRVGK